MAKVLSIEIGILTTKIVEMDYGVKKPRVYSCTEVLTPEGIIVDGYLYESKMDELVASLKEVLAYKKIKTRKVIFTVYSSKIISREVVIPAVKPHQINAVIESNVTDYFPVELDNYKISHVHLETFKEGPSAGKHKVLVVAMEKSIIGSYEELADRLGLQIVDIDYVGNSIYQCTKNKAGAGSVMIVKIEPDNMVATIIKQGTLVLQRNSNTGYADLDLRFVDAVSEQNMETIINTITRVIDFYSSNDENNFIDHIYCVGSGAAKEELIYTLADGVKLPCRALDSLVGTNLDKDVSVPDLYKYMAAIGAGTASIGFDKEVENKGAQTNYAQSAMIASVVAGIAVVAMLCVSLIPYNMELSRKKQLAADEEKYAPAKTIHDVYVASSELYNQISYGNALTEHSNDGILVFLAELENKLPQDVEVTEFLSDDEQCVITMQVADKETAAGVINMMREFQSLESISVESISEESLKEDETKTVVKKQVQDTAEDNNTEAESTDNNETEEQAAPVKAEATVTDTVDTVVIFTINGHYYPNVPMLDTVNEENLLSQDAQ